MIQVSVSEIVSVFGHPEVWLGNISVSVVLKFDSIPHKLYTIPSNWSSNFAAVMLLFY